MADCWTKVSGPVLNQGDLLDGILVPILSADFPISNSDGQTPLTVVTADVIVLTQSCDLENEKVPMVLVARYHTREQFEAKNPNFSQKGKWTLVEQGRIEGLHILSSPGAENKTKFIVVDFRDVFSLPIDYAAAHAEKAEHRHRLLSPYLEHFSQSFGHLFIRVALPEKIIETR